MTAHRAAHSIATLCRVLEVSPSGYYAWRRRGRSLRASDDAKLIAEIRAIHTDSRGTYGAPRIRAELAARGRYVGRTRVTRLMRRAGLRGVSRRKWVTTTVRNRAPSRRSASKALAATAPAWPARCAKRGIVSWKSTGETGVRVAPPASPTRWTPRWPARSVLAGQSTATPKTADGAVEMMRQLKVARDTAVKARTTAMITLKQIVVHAPPPLREALHALPDHGLLTRCAGLRPGPLDTPTAAAKHTLRALARRWTALAEEIATHEQHLARLTTTTSPTLRAGFGGGSQYRGGAVDPLRR